MTKRLQNHTNSWPRPLPAEVVRSSLLGRLTQTSDASLLVLAAPSGYGKTTLLGQLARTSKHAVWLTLSERHADLITLVNELMTSVTQVIKAATFTRIRKALAEGAQVSALAVPFAKELDGLEVNLHILIDQANLLGEDAVGWLESFALALGEGHQVFYCAYDLASERLAVPLASGRALLLTATDLAFSEEESRAYLKARGSLQDASEVQRTLEGWPAGIGLVAAGVEHIVSQDYLLSAVFARLPQNVREALPEASVLEVWREADAEKLGCKLPKGWLGEAQRAGLLLTPLSARTYRPHTLVLETLERELQSRPERYAQLHTLAGNEARKNEDLISALRHHQKAEHLSEVSKIAEELIPQLHKRQEFKLICELLESISSSESELPPETAAYYGYALLWTGQLQQSEKALRNLREKGQGEPLTSTFLAKLSFEQEKFSEAHEMIKEVLNHEIEDLYSKNFAQTVLISILNKLGHYEEALPIAQEMVAHAEVRGNRLQIAVGLTNLEYSYFRAGNFSACEQAIREALYHYTKLRMTDSTNFRLLSSNLANIYGIQGRFGETFRILSEILAVQESKSDIRHAAFLAQLAYTSEALTNYEQATAYYEEALLLYSGYGLSERIKETKYALSNAIRRNGDPKRAREILNEAHQEWSDGDRDWTGFDAYHEGLDAFDNGDMSKARQNFDTTLIYPDHNFNAISAHAYLLEIDRREGLLTLEKVEKFIDRLDALGQDSILHTDAEPKRLLYRESVARGWFAERFAPFVEPLPGNIIEPKRFVLEVKTFGGFRCNFEQKNIKFPFAKAAELLVWLTLYGPATREKIIDALWDGSRDPKHTEYGKLALRRLRTALAEYLPFNPLIYADHRYQLAAELEIELDVRDFFKAFETDDQAARRAALERYSGTPLPSVHSEWAERLRAELKDAALSTAVGLGKLYTLSDTASALWAYRKAVELEPLELDAHQALVQLLQESGNEVSARQAYRTYVRVLEDEYGEAPSLTFNELLHNTKTEHLN